MMNYSPSGRKHLSTTVLNQYSDHAAQPFSQTSGPLVSKLVKEAKKRQIPIEEDEGLLEMMASMDLGENIPPQLYAVIAEILLFIQEVEKKETK